MFYYFLDFVDSSSKPGGIVFWKKVHGQRRALYFARRLGRDVTIIGDGWMGHFLRIYEFKLKNPVHGRNRRLYSGGNRPLLNLGIPRPI
jgi:hypothetical protein